MEHAFDFSILVGLKIYRRSESFCLVQMVSSESCFVQLSDYVVFEAFGQLNPDPSCNKLS